MEITELLQPIDSLQLYGLVFLLGSYTVATLSDLRRMAAQQDFAEVWAGFAGIMFLYDAYNTLTMPETLAYTLAKWLLIIGFAALATNPAINFRISTMDVAAIAALLAVVTAGYVAIALIALLILGELMNPILKQFGEAGAYPYLPVVLTTNLLIILTHLTGILTTTTSL